MMRPQCKRATAATVTLKLAARQGGNINPTGMEPMMVTNTTKNHPTAIGEEIMEGVALNPMELDTLFNSIGDALAYCEAIRMATNDVTIPKPQANAIQRILTDIDQCVGLVRGEIGDRLNIAEEAERLGRIAP